MWAWHDLKIDGPGAVIKCSKNFVKFTGKHLCWSLLFSKVAGLNATLLIKRLRHRYFHVNFFVNILRATAFTPGDYHDIYFNRLEISPFPSRFLLEDVSDVIWIYFTPSNLELQMLAGRLLWRAHLYTCSVVTLTG